ncbi:hypothetical protein FRC12_007953 [Ceratobasidium sp. 428]|nr:hypothetical protein FRC12_007953 [Ceratobasidium sp. 428]
MLFGARYYTMYIRMRHSLVSPHARTTGVARIGCVGWTNTLQAGLVGVAASVDDTEAPASSIKLLVCRVGGARVTCAIPRALQRLAPNVQQMTCYIRMMVVNVDQMW